MDESSKKKTNGKTISFRVDEETYNLFKLMADTFGISTSKLFREMLEMGLNIFKGIGENNGNVQ